MLIMLEMEQKLLHQTVFSINRTIHVFSHMLLHYMSQFIQVFWKVNWNKSTNKSIPILVLYPYLVYIFFRFLFVVHAFNESFIKLSTIQSYN